VWATIPGFIATDAASTGVTVTVPSVNVLTANTKVGARLQSGFFTAQLTASQHGGVTVRIESSDPGIVLVAPNGTTGGTAFIDVPLGDGQVNASYYVQGVEGTTGASTITASALGFLTGSTGIVKVVQPALRIRGLPTAKSVMDPDDPFHVQVGTPNDTGTDLATLLPVQAGSGALTVTITNSDDLVAELVTDTVIDQIVTVQIQENQFSSPTTVDAGGVAFRPLDVGTAEVAASIPDFLETGAATVLVDVTP
jgi:hypothetical protein